MTKTADNLVRKKLFVIVIIIDFNNNSGKRFGF